MGTVFSGATPAVDTKAAVNSQVRFEVVSIRPSQPGANEGTHFSFSPDGYHARGQSMWSTTMVAYYPLPVMFWADHLKGAPRWFGDLYDIDAKVADADLPVWRAQDPNHPVLLQEALQAMLEQRCGERLHTVQTSSSALQLVVLRSTNRLAPSVVGAKVPEGAVNTVLTGKGFLVPSSGDLRFIAVTMGEFAGWLTQHASKPVLDGTGLSGRYDFTLAREVPLPGEPEGEVDSKWLQGLRELGLGLKRATTVVPVLVIDQVERPTAN